MFCISKNQISQYEIRYALVQSWLRDYEKGKFDEYLRFMNLERSATDVLARTSQGAIREATCRYFQRWTYIEVSRLDIATFYRHVQQATQSDLYAHHKKMKVAIRRLKAFLLSSKQTLVASITSHQVNTGSPTLCPPGNVKETCDKREPTSLPDGCEFSDDPFVMSDVVNADEDTLAVTNEHSYISSLKSNPRHIIKAVNIDIDNQWRGPLPDVRMIGKRKCVFEEISYDQPPKKALRSGTVIGGDSININTRMLRNGKAIPMVGSDDASNSCTFSALNLSHEDFVEKLRSCGKDRNYVENHCYMNSDKNNRVCRTIDLRQIDSDCVEIQIENEENNILMTSVSGTMADRLSCLLNKLFATGK